MTIVGRARAIRLAGVALAAAVRMVSGGVPVLADGPPVLTGVQPLTVQLNGQPMRVTLTGADLTTVITVTLVPAVPGLTFTVTSPTTVVVTLPPSTPPDTYGVFVSGSGGTSDLSDAPQLTVTYPVAADPGPPPLPRYSFAPTPQQRDEPVTGVAGEVTPAVAPAPSRRAWNPLLLVVLGAAIGGAGYGLWGRPGRLDRQGWRAHLVGRPLQALRLGRICLQCGRLHLVFATRSDLWRAGQFCSATCFVAAQEDDSAARAGESTAVTRMREMFVYSEMEKSLQEALAGDVAALEHAAAVGDPAIEAVLAPGI